MSESSDFCESRKPECSKKKTKSAIEVASDGTVHGARTFEILNVNWESASDVKSQLLDQDTCAQIKEGTGKCHFETLCTSCHMKPRRSAGRGQRLAKHTGNGGRGGGDIKA